MVVSITLDITIIIIATSKTRALNIYISTMSFITMLVRRVVLIDSDATEHIGADGGW